MEMEFEKSVLHLKSYIFFHTAEVFFVLYVVTFLNQKEKKKFTKDTGIFFVSSVSS